MNAKLKDKLKTLPNSPGVYFHKNIKNQIIYVGKAANLKNRVKQYFMNSSNFDPKTKQLVSLIEDTDWMVVESEFDALFLEAEMIKRYKPKYNILLRDDKSSIYIRIDYKSNHPTVTTTRFPLDDKAYYFGPYLSSTAISRALRILRPVFPYAIKNSGKKVSLDYHLGLDPGLEENKTSLQEYRSNLRKLIAVIEGKKDQLIKDLYKDMEQKAKKQDFESAAKIRNQITSLKNLTNKIIFSDKEFQDISKDHALNELQKLLGLNSYLKRLEGYDISHMSGTNVVASMVVFSNGISDKKNYRKFKIYQDKNNDFLNMQETIYRRLSPKNIKAWGLASLVVIDGGKGQLKHALKARNDRGVKVPFIALAKREEQIVISKKESFINLNQNYLNKLNGFMVESEDFIVINLPHSTNIVKLLQRIRDESHRFAVSYHSTLKTKNQKNSALDQIPGIGSKTKTKLIRKYGSLKNLKEQNLKELASFIGPTKAKTILNFLQSESSD